MPCFRSKVGSWDGHHEQGRLRLIPDQELLAGLDAFAKNFEAQVSAVGAPAHEHAIHFCLALGLQVAHDFPPGALVFERALGSKRIDLWVAPWDLAIEVKYQRPIPGGYNRPFPQLYGSLLADLNKVVQADAGDRLVVFVVDEPGMKYLEKNHGGILPLSVGLTTDVVESMLSRLSATASRGALTHGPWIGLRSELVWRSRAAGWHLLAWRVAYGES
jgi:hypothetical protein